MRGSNPSLNDASGHYALVKLVIGLTPYGVLALMTRVIATTDGGAIITLIGFVVASYIAIAIMFMVHGLIIAMVGVNVREYQRCGQC